MADLNYTNVWLHTLTSCLTQCIDTTPQTHTHTYSKQIVESGQSFQEEVGTFVRELIPSSDEEEQTFIQVEVKVPKGPTL